MKYEFDIVSFGEGYWHESTLSTMTGLPFDEVHEVVKATRKRCWGGRLYINVIRSLGFNTNPKFIKFEPNTPYPVILRCCNHVKGYWYVFYYHNGIIYDHEGNSFQYKDLGHVSNLNDKYYLKNYNMRVTSMLQVWI